MDDPSVFLVAGRSISACLYVSLYLVSFIFLR